MSKREKKINEEVGMTDAVGCELTRNGWKDATRYMRGERGTKAPDAWIYDRKDLTIYITSGHLRHPDEWIMHCRDVDLEEEVLCAKTEPLEEAQALAVMRVRNRLLKMTLVLEEMKNPALSRSRE